MLCLKYGANCSALQAQPERLVELLTVEDTVLDTVNPKSVVQPSKGDVNFNDVGFHYPTRPEQAALDGVSFSVRSGETVALVGPSGGRENHCYSIAFAFLRSRQRLGHA